MAEPVDCYKIPSLAKRYKKYRDEVPEQCVKKVVSFLEEKFKANESIAVDVGCGSGQGTRPLAQYMKEIIGIDSSEAQLSEARSDKMPSNITFRVGRAEALPVDDESAHLVTATFAAHWFNYPAFIEEVDRVLIPGGVLAITGSDGPFHILGNNDEIENIVQELRDAAEEYRYEKNKGWQMFYKTVELPYKSFIRDHSVEIVRTTSLADFIGKYKTFSTMARFLDTDPEKAEQAFQRFQDRLIRTLNIDTPPEDVFFTYKKRFIILLCRKPER